MTQSEAIGILSFIASNSNSISDVLYYTILEEKYSEVVSKLKHSEIVFEDFGNNIISITTNFYNENQLDVYCSIESFYAQFNENENTKIILGNKKINTIISATMGNSIHFQSINNGNINNTATNYYYLKKIIGLLSLPPLTDYKDTALNRYFFLSPECGKFEIIERDYTNLVDIADSSINLFDTYSKVKSMFCNPEGWQYILKNKIIRGLENIDISDNRFKELVLNLTKFIDATKKDFELFLTSKKHESIVQQFENEKYIFIDKIRSVLQRISSSIISIPLTFFGASFAMREIDKLWLLNIVVISIIIYIAFSIAVFFLLWSDLDNIKEEISTKKNIISMGLSHLQNDLNEIIKPLNKRIMSLKILVVAAIILFALIFLFFIYQYTNQEPPYAQ
jgi:hypothetical protein